MNEHTIPEMYTFDFKYVHTCKKITLSFDPNINMKQFIEQIKEKVNNNKIEIVKAGQYINGVFPEDAPHVISSDNTLKTIYGENWKNIAFYIRKELY